MVVMTGFNSGNLSSSNGVTTRMVDDSLIWKVANTFTRTFNKGDVYAMNQFLPDGFMLQWLHQNFLEKKGLLASMIDSTVHSSLRFVLTTDSNTKVRYSDDLITASLNTSFCFLDPLIVDAINNEKGYGLCIMYFRNRRGKWILQTVHLDLHCYNCNL